MRALAAAAVLLAVLPAGPARAGGASYAGGCSYDSVRVPPVSRAPGGTFTGVLSLAVAVVPGTDPGVEADVTCELMVNGVPHTTIGPVRAAPAAVATAPFTVTISHSWAITMCESVSYTDGTPPSRTCTDHVAICDPVCRAREQTDPYVDPVEADLCGRIGGDVYAGGQWVYDCPPYGPS